MTPRDPDTHQEQITINPALIAALLRPVELLSQYYFRGQVSGLEHIPHGSALLVGNHNGGITSADPFIFGAAYYRARGTSEPIYALAHDAMLAVPLLRDLLRGLGSVRASPENAARVFEQGGKVLVYPGGNIEAFRPFCDRYRINLAGRTGFIKLALQSGVPIVPIVHIGGHETFFVLHSGRNLAKLLRLKQLLRSDTCALALALPFGISFGPVFHLPLPAKCEVQVGEPIVFQNLGFDAADADRPEALSRLYQLVLHRMQDMMDRLAAKRHFPVIG